MVKADKLSNKELVDELMKYTPQVAQCDRCVELSEEILRRLNEPWRKKREQEKQKQEENDLDPREYYG